LTTGKTAGTASLVTSSLNSFIQSLFILGKISNVLSFDFQILTEPENDLTKKEKKKKHDKGFK